MINEIGGSVIDASTYARVEKAADELFSRESNNGKMPRVDDVRRLAAVSMNDASNGMKIWRKKKLSEVEPSPIAVPELVMKSFNASIGEAWQQAQQLANESLKAAQSSWDSERHELEEQRLSMAMSFDMQAQELVDLKKGYEEDKFQSEQVIKDINQRLANALVEVESVQSELSKAKAEAVQSELRAVEISKRVDDLKEELNHTRTELKEARSAREEAAELRGKLKGAEQQLAEMLKLLKP